MIYTYLNNWLSRMIAKISWQEQHQKLMTFMNFKIGSLSLRLIAIFHNYTTFQLVHLLIYHNLLQEFAGFHFTFETLSNHHLLLMLVQSAADDVINKGHKKTSVGCDSSVRSADTIIARHYENVGTYGVFNEFPKEQTKPKHTLH